MQAGKIFAFCATVLAITILMVTLRSQVPYVCIACNVYKNGGLDVDKNAKLREYSRICLGDNELIDWSKLLQFVPERDSKDDRCNFLFRTSTTKHIKLSDEYRRKYAIFETELKRLEAQGLRRGMRVEGRTIQIKTYAELARADFVKTVCEIGFNAGHSAITWLTAKPDLHLYAFDLGRSTATKPMAKYIDGMFPGRFNITYGDSLVTVPEWFKKGIKCDLVSVDGGHAYEFALGDLKNMRFSVARKHILVADDVHSWSGVKRAWKEMVKAGVIEEKLYCSFGIGQYAWKYMHQNTQMKL